MKVLLVEDNPIDASVIRRSFANSTLDCDLTWAKSLSEGVDQLRASTFDVILTDLMLPDAANLQAPRTLYEAADYAPVIVLTSVAEGGMSDKALACGVQDYLVKDRLAPDLLQRSIQYAIHRQQVKNENMRLMREVEHGKESLIRKNRRLKRMYRMAQEFVDHVSHEFRTPLTVIKEYASLIHDGVVGHINDEQKRLLRVVDDRTDDLNTMVDDMLDVSKLNAGLLGAWRKACTVKNIVQHVLPHLQRKAATHNAELQTEIDSNLPTVYCDAEKAGRVIVNLVVNAIKFSGQEGKIHLWARTDLEHNEVQVGITDNGPGIGADDMERIFKRFTKLNHRMPNSKGFGLGLSIAMELADLNFGSMSVESELGRGSTFSFTLPMAIPQLIVQRYLRRLQHRRSGGRQSVSLLRISLDGEVASELAADTDQFLNFMLRRDDLLFRIGAAEWLLVLAMPRIELDDFLNRTSQTLKDANRNRPYTPLPDLLYEYLGCWSCLEDGTKILNIFDQCCAHLEIAGI